jgi:hypothetical protein
MTINQELPALRNLPPERRDAAKRQLERAISGHRRKWAWGWKPSLVAGIILSVSVGGGFAIAASLTKGPVPIGPNGELELNHAPDFVSVASDGKVVGYTPRAYLIAPSHGPLDERLGSVAPVYSSNLTTVVGHMYPGIGYVPDGVNPTSLPCVKAYYYSGSTRQSITCPSTSVVVPNVVGLYAPTAMARLSSLSFQATPRYEHSASVPKGHVVSVSPSVGRRVMSRTLETVTISEGPNS